MHKKSEDFSMENARRLMENPAAAQLIDALKRADADALNKAAQLAASGDYSKAAETIRALLSDSEARKLLGKLGGKADG